MRAKLAQPSQMWGVWKDCNAYYEARRCETDGKVDYAWWQILVEDRWRTFHVDDLTFERV